MSEFVKETLPHMIISFLMAWMVLEYFFPVLGPLIPLTDTLRTYATVLAAAAWGLGTAVLTANHVRRIYRQQTEPHWLFSVVYMLGFAIMLIYGLIEGKSGSTFIWYYDVIVAPAGQALYSTTAFFITSAGYRIFRFRNLDATVLLIAGTLVLWSVLPLFTGFFPFLGPIGAWVSDVPAVAGYRAFTIGVALGTIGLGVRIFLQQHKEILA
jgi:hypothetical protein